jgi:hypothetical protein
MFMFNWKQCLSPVTHHICEKEGRKKKRKMTQTFLVQWFRYLHRFIFYKHVYFFFHWYLSNYFKPVFNSFFHFVSCTKRQLHFKTEFAEWIENWIDPTLDDVLEWWGEPVTSCRLHTSTTKCRTDRETSIPHFSNQCI